MTCKCLETLRHFEILETFCETSTASPELDTFYIILTYFDNHLRKGIEMWNDAYTLIERPLAYLLTFYLAFYLTSILPVYLTYFLTFYLAISELAYFVTLHLTSILTIYLAYFLMFYLAFYLAFCPASIWHSI